MVAKASTVKERMRNEVSFAHVFHDYSDGVVFSWNYALLRIPWCVQTALVVRANINIIEHGLGNSLHESYVESDVV
jgi:hypothetical protein